jgi:hypothetical protein
MAKIFLGLLLAASTLCFVCAGILALRIRGLDLQILDRYFVVWPRYLIMLGAGLLLAAFAVWRTVVSH